MAFLWLINGGDPNHLLTGMILQVRPGQAEYSPNISGTKNGGILTYKLYGYGLCKPTKNAGP